MSTTGKVGRLLWIACFLFIGCSVPSFSDVLKEGIFSVEYHVDEVDVARRSMTVLQSAMREFTPRLPAQDRTIHVRIAPSIDDFARFTGSYSRHQVLGIARSAQGMIVVKSPAIMLSGEEFTTTLRHELVHVLLERNTEIAVLPRWLNEGIAMHLSGDYSWGSTFRIGKMYLYNQIISYPELDFTFIAPGSNEKFSDAYAQAISMTRYLEDELGEERFWAVVKGCETTSFADALYSEGGITLRQFLDGYSKSLWGNALVGVLSTGSFFLPMPFILMLAYWRRRRRDKVILDQWELEEVGEADYAPEPVYDEDDA